MPRLGSFTRGALSALALVIAVTLGAAACTSGTTPDCADAACGYSLQLPDTGLSASDAGGETGAAE